MNEPPGVRLRVGPVRLDDGRAFPRSRPRCAHLHRQHLPLFARRARKFRRCWGACHPPSATNPTLSEEMGMLQERITSTRSGSITSMQAVYVPADDYSDPAPVAVFTHSGQHNRAWNALLPRAWLCSRLSIPLASTSNISAAGGGRRGPLQHRARSTASPAALQGFAGHHCHSRRGRALRRRQSIGGARAQNGELPQPTHGTLPSNSPGRPAAMCPIKDTVRMASA